VLRSKQPALKGKASTAVKEQTGEVFARQALEANKISAAIVQKALSLAEVPLSANRRNVIPKGEDAVRGAVCGLFVFAHKIGISAYSRQRPWLTRLLIEFAKSAGYGSFPFTSIQVNVDYAARPHTDRNNLGKSLIVGLGRYTGGRLWVHDDHGKESLTLQEDLPQEALYRKGVSFQGTAHDIRDRWLVFDGNRLHGTQPFKGRRYSLVYFTCDRYADTPEFVQEELRGVGFTFPWRNQRLQQKLATKRTKKKELRKKVTKEKFSFHKGVVPDLIDKDRVRYRKQNPKQPGCAAWKLFEKYKKAITFGQAKKLGARGIDLLFDYNQSFMEVTCIHPEPPAGWNHEVLDPTWAQRTQQSPAISRTGSETVNVRVKNMRPRHPGLQVPRSAVWKLAALIPSLRKVKEDSWADQDGPLAKLPLGAVRIFFFWASSGKLRLRRTLTPIVAATLRAWGEKDLAHLTCGAKGAPVSKKR